MVRLLCLLAIVPMACGPAVRDIPGTKVAFDLSRRWNTSRTFFDFPWPSDARLTGGQNLAGFPNRGDNSVVAALLRVAGEHPGVPVVPVAYFKFDAPLAPRDPEAVIAAATSSPILLVDVDARSPERGTLYPIVATVFRRDDYAADHLLAVGPRPGIVLVPGRTYAYVVRRSLGDAEGKPLGVPASFRMLAEQRPGADAALAALYAPLFSTLGTLAIPVADVAAATVFTTSDVVVDIERLSTALSRRFQPVIERLALDPDDGDHPRYCELLGRIRYPQFQQGVPPFDEDGLFALGEGGLPVAQREEEAPVVVTIPKSAMPPAGYPLLLYFHGSGGLSSQLVDRGRIETAGGTPRKGEGPAHVVAPIGLAAAGSAMPLNPERAAGAGELAYLNFGNLPAFRDTFRQGVVEARIFLDALLRLEIAPSALGSCAGPMLPAGASAFRFDPSRVVGMGQSMGGMYINLVGAIDPRIRAVVPTGAGGFWSHFMTYSPKVPRTLLTALLSAPQATTFLHPALHLVQLAWETVDPIAFAPRLARRPLAGHPVRPLYEPVAIGDSYFSTQTYDAMALAYGHQQAGTVVWPTMQEALALARLDGVIAYPVGQNRRSANEAPYTGVVVQYEGDGIYDPHSITFQLDAVKHQYTCFLSTYLERGLAVVPAPAALGSPCP